MRRTFILLGLSTAVALGGAAYVAFRPREETPRRVRVFKPPEPGVPVEGDAAWIVDPAKGLWATHPGPNPEGEFQARLLTSRDPADECTEKCLHELTVEGGEAARRSSFEVAETLVGLIRGLAEVPDLDPALASHFRSTLDALEARFAQGADAHVRVLLVRSRMQTPDGLADAVGVAIYDAYDKVFDEKRPPTAGGIRILANRIQTVPVAPGEVPRIRSGVVEVSHEGMAIERSAMRTSNSGPLRLFRSPIVNHFLNDQVAVAGLAYNTVGGPAVYGLSPKPRNVPGSPRLLAALAAVLRGL